MKKYIGIMLSILMIVIVCSACSTNNNQDTSENSYITMAKEFIDAGDYDSALKILEKGYKETGDAAIAVMMAELTVDEETVASTVPEESGSVTAVENPLEAYRGIWAEDGICAEYGGMIMAVYPIEDSECRLELQLTQGIPMSRIANVVLEFETKDLKENSIEIWFEDDGWGSEGIAFVTFDNGFIDCEIYDTKYNGVGDFADWGLAEGLYELYRNEDAFEQLTSYLDNSNETVDTGDERITGSSILAHYGISEDDFRAQCIFLTEKSKTENNYRDYYPHVSIDELKAYPDDYVGMFFVVEPNVNNVDDIYNGERSLSGIEVLGKKTTTDGYYYYECTVYGSYHNLSIWEMLDMEIDIIDVRDNTSLPNITDGDLITPYMIFTGMQGNIPVFQMISVDVDYD